MTEMIYGNVNFTQVDIRAKRNPIVKSQQDLLRYVTSLIAKYKRHQNSDSVILPFLENMLQLCKKRAISLSNPTSRYKKKRTCVRKKIRNKIQNVVVRMIVFKNHAETSHRSRIKKSVKNTSPSCSSDGGDPDPDRATKAAIPPSYIHILRFALASLLALFALISITEVAK